MGKAKRMDFWRFQSNDPALGPVLQGSHDPSLTVAAVVIACLAGCTALTLAHRLTAARGRARILWLWGGALALGCGIWAMHFTAMLAFTVDGNHHLGYELGLTLVSILPGVLGSAAAIHLVSQPEPGRGRLLACALLLALGIGAMHYTGMEAMHMAGLRYDPALFALSIVVAFLLALVALALQYGIRRWSALPAAGVLAGVVLGLAISGMHYVAMAAARFHATPSVPTHAHALMSDVAMVLTVIGFAGLVLSLGVFVAWLDRQVAVRRMLEHLAHTDALTGLPNRIRFHGVLDRALARCRRHDRRLAVLFLDLNDFKTINDSLGHLVGDRVLQHTATRLKGALREHDVVARFGGDEFIVLVEGMDAAEDASRPAARILKAMEDPIEVDAWKLHATPSIGISMFPDDGSDADELIKQADAAMYAAKSRSLGHCFFDSTLTESAMERVRLGNELRGAIADQQLYLNYQPWVDMACGKRLGFEALARWSHPDDGLISPARFIPIVERSGLVLAFGEWALRTACAQGRAWLDQGEAFGAIAVNISARQFAEANFPRRLEQLLEESGLPPTLLQLEITESSLIDTDGDVLRRLLDIRRLGVALAVDDFGTGYSSLSYLKELPVTTLKIDRAFVQGLVDSSRDRAIVRAVAQMGASLGFAVVAEGVETEDQRDCLLELGCHRGQGFLFARPAAAQDLVPARPAPALPAPRTRAVANPRHLPLRSRRAVL